MSNLLTNDPFITQMEKALDVMTRRNALTATNVANMDTPGYRTADIDFDSVLREVIGAQETRTRVRGTSERHITSSPHEGIVRAERVAGLTIRNDGNDVSLDREMAMLAQTRHRYEAASTFIRLQLRQIRAALADRS